MERTSLHNDSLLYASLIAILLLISYWFTTRCFKIISGIEGMGLGTRGDRVMLAHPVSFHEPGGEASQALGVGERDWVPHLCLSGAPRSPTQSLYLFLLVLVLLHCVREKPVYGHSRAAAVPRAAPGSSSSAVLPTSGYHCPSLRDRDVDRLPGASRSVGSAQCRCQSSTCILGLLVPLGMTYIFAPQLVCWGAPGCGGGSSFPSEGSLQAPLQWDVHARGFGG